MLAYIIDSYIIQSMHRTALLLTVTYHKTLTQQKRMCDELKPCMLQNQHIIEKRFQAMYVATEIHQELYSCTYSSYFNVLLCFYVSASSMSQMLYPW